MAGTKPADERIVELLEQILAELKKPTRMIQHRGPARMLKPGECRCQDGCAECAGGKT
jgi:hypothetical protein